MDWVQILIPQGFAVACSCALNACACGALVWGVSYAAATLLGEFLHFFVACFPKQ